MSKSKGPQLGGLLTRLKPFAEIDLHGTDYVVRNIGVLTAELHVYSRSRLEEIRRLENHESQNEAADENEQE